MLYGSGKEYVDASRELGTPFSPGIIIIILILLFFCTWLIGSGFSKDKLKFNSLKFTKFFILSFSVFILMSFISLMYYVIPSNFLVINGLKIPMNKCIDGSVKIVPNEKERKEYCKCLAEKITNDSDLKEKYKKDLEKGQLDKVFKELQSTDKFAQLDIESCMTSIEIKWTKSLANTMKENWKRELIGTTFEQSNDIDKFCNCLISEYQKHPINEIMKDGFYESDIALSINEKCMNNSLRK